MAQALSHKGYLGIAKESTWGTKVVPPTEFLEMENDSILVTIPEVPSPMINNGRAMTKRSQGLKTVGGGVPWDVNAEDFIGHTLLSILPTETFVDDVPNSNGEHTFKIGDTLPAGYTIQAGRGDFITDNFGGQCMQLDMAWVPGEHLKAVSTWSFKDSSAGSANVPSYTTQNPLICTNGTFEIDDVASEFLSANLSIVTGIHVDRPQLGSNLSASKQQVPGVYIISGEAVVYFESVTERDKYLNGTASKLEFGCIGKALGADFRELKFTLPNVFYNGQTETNPSRDEGDLKLTIPFMAYSLAGADLIEVLLRNSRQSAY